MLDVPGPKTEREGRCDTGTHGKDPTQHKRSKVGRDGRTDGRTGGRTFTLYVAKRHVPTCSSKASAPHMCWGPGRTLRRD